MLAPSGPSLLPCGGAVPQSTGLSYPFPSVSLVGKNSKGPEQSPGPPPALPSSSLENITQCWQSVVQEQVGSLEALREEGVVAGCGSFMSLLPSQVSRFLAAAWRASDFVPRYCKLYAHLQRVGSELFGLRAAFTLALRSGFSGALLQQSFLTTAHVSATAWASLRHLPLTLLPPPISSSSWLAVPCAAPR